MALDMTPNTIAQKTRYVLLAEDDRLDFLRKKYGTAVKARSPRPAPGQEPQDDFDLLVAADPTSKTNAEGALDHAGKYSEWIIKNYLADETGRYIEDLPKMTDDLSLFDRFKARLPAEQRDINKLTAVQLWHAAEEIKKQKKGDVKTKEEVANTEQKVLYKDESVIAIQPLTWKASVVLGRGTRWCTAADSSNGKSMFDHYTTSRASDGGTAVNKERFLVIFKFADGFRAQLEVNENGDHTQLMDIEDRSINIVQLVNHYTGQHREKFFGWLSSFTNIRHHAALARQNADTADTAKHLTTRIADEPISTRLALARAANLSDEELAQLKSSATTEVSRAILRYQKVEPAEFAAALAGANNAIKLGAASNPYLPVELMQAITAGKDSIAKTGLACNKSAPQEILAKLPKDVLDFAKTVPRDSDDSRAIILSIARGVQLAPEELAMLKSGDMDPALQRTLLRHQKVDTSELSAALNSKNLALKIAAGRNPNLPVELMRAVALGNDRGSKVGVANNPNLPPDVEAILMKDADIAKVIAGRKKSAR